MEMAKRILVVDDDAEIRNLLSEFLHKHGYEVSSAKDGQELFQLLRQQPHWDLIILDVMLPGADGFTLCRQIHHQFQIAIMMLTAVNDDVDKVLGLESGADDYLAKPFNPRELLARIKAILRRTSQTELTKNTQEESPSTFQFNHWKLNTNTRCLLASDDTAVNLSTASYNLLLAFLEHPQQILSRDQLMEMTKNRGAGPFDRGIDIQVSRLRQKLGDDPKEPQLIKTIRSGGYFFTPTVIKL